jgi:hypothetical protein
MLTLSAAATTKSTHAKAAGDEQREGMDHASANGSCTRRHSKTLRRQQIDSRLKGPRAMSWAAATSRAQGPSAARVGTGSQRRAGWRW